jgi:hypothetical protein
MFVFIPLSPSHARNTCSNTNTNTGTAQRLPQQWYSYQRFYRHCVFRVSGLSNRHRQHAHNTYSNTEDTGTAQWLPRQWYSYQRFYRHGVFRVSGLSNRHRQPLPHATSTTTSTQSSLTATLPTQYSTLRHRELAPSSTHHVRATSV